MAIRRDSLTMKLGGGAPRVRRGLPRGPGARRWLREPDRAARVAVREGELARRHHRSADRGPAGPGARGALRSRRLRPARARLPPAGARDRRSDLLSEGRRAPSSRRCGCDPRDFTATSGLGSLALARHDFRGGLALGEQAARISPGVARNYGVIVDAQVELGRYGAAERTLQHFVDLKPNLSLVRAGLLLPRAARRPAAARSRRCAWRSPPAATRRERRLRADAARQARASIAADSPPPRAPTATALATDPGYLPAQAGLARVEAARGDYAPRSAATARVVAAAAAARVRGRARRDGAGRRADAAAARATSQLVGAEERLLQRERRQHRRRAGALRGRPRRSVAGRRRSRARAWAAAPSVRSADALGWALTRRGQDRARRSRCAQRALRLGSRDPSFLYHAGMGARAPAHAQRRGATCSRLARAEPALHPLYAPRARARAGGPAMRRVARLRRPRRAARGCGVRHAAPAARLGAPARQLLGQPPEPGADLAGIGGRPLHPRPGRDPHLPGAQRFDRNGDGAIAGPEREPLLERKLAEVAPDLRLTVDGRAVALEPARQAELSPSRRAGRAATDPRRAPLVAAVPPGAHGSSSTTTRSPAGSAGRRSSPAGRRHRRALERPPSDPTGWPARLPAGPPAEPAGPARGELRGERRAPAASPRREGQARRPRDHRSRAATASPARSTSGHRPRRAHPAAARLRLRLGRAARALARARQDDGRRLPGRHARHGPRHAVVLGATVTITHTIGVFALGLVTLPLSPVHPARGPLPVAQPRLRRDGDRDRAVGVLDSRCGAGGRPEPSTPRPRPQHGHGGHGHSHGHGRARTVRSADHDALADRTGGLGRHRPLPVGPGRPARRDLAAPARPRARS